MFSGTTSGVLTNSRWRSSSVLVTHDELHVMVRPMKFSRIAWTVFVILKCSSLLTYPFSRSHEICRNVLFQTNQMARLSFFFFFCLGQQGWTTGWCVPGIYEPHQSGRVHLSFYCFSQHKTNMCYFCGTPSLNLTCIFTLRTKQGVLNFGCY